MKISLLGAELFRADGQTDMSKLIVVFRNFANRPKTVSTLHPQLDLCNDQNDDGETKTVLGFTGTPLMT
jgi:hypothetical protein